MGRPAAAGLLLVLSLTPPCARAVAPLAAEVERLARHVAVLAERLGDWLLTRAEAAAYLGVSTRTLDCWTREGRVSRASESPPRHTVPGLDKAL